MIEKYEKWCSVAFTGHRFISSDRVEEVRESVNNEIRLLYSKGFRNFFCGMALGFDMLAAEEVLKLKEELPAILLVAPPTSHLRPSTYSQLIREQTLKPCRRQ